MPTDLPSSAPATPLPTCATCGHTSREHQDGIGPCEWEQVYIASRSVDVCACRGFKSIPSAPAGSPPENAACSHGIEGLCFACLPARRCSFHERTNALNAAIRAAHKSGASPDSIAALAQIRDRLYDYRQDGHEKTALKNRIRNYRRAIKQLQKAYDLRESLIDLSISRAARRHDERLNGARESQELRSQLSALREENERLKGIFTALECRLKQCDGVELSYLSARFDCDFTRYDGAETYVCERADTLQAAIEKALSAAPPLDRERSNGA